MTGEPCGYQQNGLSRPMLPTATAPEELNRHRNRLALQSCVLELQELIGDPLSWNWDHPEYSLAGGTLDACERRFWDFAALKCLNCKGNRCEGRALILLCCGGCQKVVVRSQWGVTLLLCYTCCFCKQTASWQRAAQELTETRSLREARWLFENHESWDRLRTKWALQHTIEYIKKSKKSKVIAVCCERKDLNNWPRAELERLPDSNPGLTQALFGLKILNIS